MASRLVVLIFIVSVSTLTNSERTRLNQDVEDKQQSKSTNSVVSGLKVPTSSKETSKPQRILKVSNRDHGREFAGIEAPGSIVQVQAKIHICQPKVEPHHNSSAYVAIESGRGGRFNQIEVGWTVNPDFYGDNHVHLYTKWTSNNNRVCYNYNCVGFYKVAKENVLGTVLTPSNAGQNIEKDLSVQLVQEWDRKWWLYVHQMKVGYWESKYFCTLCELATTVRFGGEVYTPPSSIVSPPMGSGLFMNSYTYYETCYFSDIQVNYDDDLQGAKIKTSRCYFVGGLGKGGPQGFGFLFGGVGGKDMESCVY